MIQSFTALARPAILPLARPAVLPLARPAILPLARLAVFPLARLVFFSFALLILSALFAKAAPLVVDDAGREVRLQAPARRVIPLYAALGECLAALGLADLAVGRTNSDDSLPRSLPVVGTHMRPNPELVAALKPDLVLQFEGREEAAFAADNLERLGIVVARFRISSFSELFSCLRRIGVLCAEEQKAERLVASLAARLAALRNPAEISGWRDGPGKDGPGKDGPEVKPSVFFEVRYPNLLGAGGRSMPGDIIRHAGGVNCLEDYPDRMVRLGEESLIAMNPDIYLIQHGTMNKNPLSLKERAHFAALGAAKTDFAFFVEESAFSRPGPRSVDAAEELAAIIRRWREAGGRR